MIGKRILLVAVLVMILFSTSSNFAGVDRSGGITSGAQISHWILTPGEYIRTAWDSLFHRDEVTALKCEDFMR